MLLTEEQTEHYLTDMIQFYGEKVNNTKGIFSWDRTEAEYKKKTFEDMRIVLFGDDYNEDKREKIT
jgi:hypothetical protein